MERLWDHLALALFTILGCLLALMLDPSAILAEPLSLGLGYVSLFYLAVSLLIGPLYLARRRRNPVNINLRRDIGIWAGITALLHVLVSFQVFQQGQILLYFFSRMKDQYLPLLNLFGLSNDVGLLAAVIALVLLVLSNDVSLRWLKGKRWKFIQRFTYPLIVLAILHTLGFQIDNARDAAYIVAVVALTLIVALAQGSGALVHLRRRRLRLPARATTRPNAAPAGLRSAQSVPAPARVLEPVAEDVSRRRFLVLGGTALVAAVAGLVSFRVTEGMLSNRGAAEVPGEADAPAPTSGAGNVATAPTATVPAEAAVAPPLTATAPEVSNTALLPTATTPEVSNTAPPPTAPPTADSSSALAAPTATSPPVADVPATPDTGTSGGVVLATLAACPLNSALNFTTPDTGETGILVREADGSVKAFSNLCTHRPYPVEYDPSAHELVCPLHYAYFDAQSGDPTRGPARRALPVIPVHLDGQGNIIYG